MNLKSRLDLTEIFCEVDDFYQSFEKHCSSVPQLTAIAGEKKCSSRLSLSEVMTIVIAFHGSGFRTFKDFYTLQVLPNWKKAFPNKRELQSFRRTNALVNDAAMLFSTDEKRGDHRD